MSRPIIRIGDSTSHGGTVLEGFANFDINGVIASGVGHAVSCPICSGSHVIVGPGPGPTVNGIEIAVEGMTTDCGAALIPSQRAVTID